MVPEKIIINKKGQIKEVSVHIPAGLKIGNHSGIIEFSSSEIIISPNKCKFSLSIEPEKSGSKPLLFIIFIIIFAYLLHLILRSKTIWIKKGDFGEIIKIEVRSLRKTNLKEVSLSNYFLKYGMLTKILLGNEGKTKKEIIKYSSSGSSSPIECQNSDDYKVTLYFYKKKPGDELVCEENNEDNESTDTFLD